MYDGDTAKEGRIPVQNIRATMKVPPFNNLENADAAPADPLALFYDWFAQAERSEPVDPNAMGFSGSGCKRTLEHFCFR